MSDLTVDQNDDEVINIAVKKADGTAADLSGCKLDFAVRSSRGASTVLIAKSSAGVSPGITIVSPATAGNAKIAFVPADTADLDVKYLGRDLVWELDGVDSVNHEITLARGTIVINRDLVA